MSHPHPTLSAWTRDEHDGHYSAELHDWQLEVRWTPNQADARGHFSWKAERDESNHKGEQSYEELEHAMAAAEAFAAADAERRSAEVLAGGGGGDGDEDDD